MRKLDSASRRYYVKARFDFPCLVLSERVAHCRTLADMIRPQIDGVEVLTGRLSKRKREQVMQQARSGGLRVIVATQVADEDLDLPELDRLFLTTLCRSTAKV